jgi:opacity protein-like surface antigen
MENIMKLNKSLLAMSLLSTVFLANNYAVADDWEFHVAGGVAKKSLNNENDSLQAQGIDGLMLKQDSYLSLMFDFKKAGWPVAIVLDTFITGDTRKSNGFEETGSTLETHLGVRKYWGSKKQGWESYLGGGIALTASDLSSEFEDSKVSQDDTDTGYWLGGGANWFFTENWYVGGDLRYSTGTLEVFEQERDVDAVMAGLTVGYSF